jgi:opacity protein-like surface antigen
MALKSKVVFALCILPLVASAASLGVGGYFAPGLVLGEVADDAGLTYGVKGRFSIGDGVGFTPRVTVAYSRINYGLYEGLLLATYSRVENYDTLMVDAGVDLGFDWGLFNPFIGGGLVITVGLPQTPFDETVFDVAPGIAVGGGVRLRLNGNWACEVAPRYSYLFDDPVRAAAGADDLFRTGARTQLVEVPLGLVYSF